MLLSNDGNASLNVAIRSSDFTLENRFWIYSAPVILTFGICTNILTMVVQSRPRFRGTSTRVYLTMLAVGDLIVIVVGLSPEWLHQLHVISLWDVNIWICRVEMYLFYTSLDFAIWTLMLFSCDRLVAVCFPLKKKTHCTPRRAVIACGLAFMVANLNAYVFWSRGAEYTKVGTLVGNCRYLPRYRFFELSIRPIVVLCAAFIAPFVVIAISNVIIIVRLATARRMRKRCSSSHSGRVAPSARRRSSQTTAMCLSASVAFLVLVLPNIILFMGKRWWSPSASYYLVKAVASQLVYIHHSINFVLYSLSGERFRRELYHLCGRGRPHSVYRSWSSSSTSSKEVILNMYSVYDSASSPLVDAIQKMPRRKPTVERSVRIPETKDTSA
ncbi:hypothetical protein LSH36_40g02020 [Paralvinella palmiformis]|uniref:G-protein coupled receptors family 1 profile domain-containing protein n=1 Tax=Paralvinella palmiformis TaxID=53620 RepID=A0AAD9K7C8_9ANNE|nr:hypothetical protein LSH36_40g02020 [Paralvinella palmiformis]